MSFDWLPRVSFYQQNQLWTAKQQQPRQDTQDTMSALSDSFANASAGQVSGMAGVTLQTALDRVQAAYKAKQAAAAAADDAPDLSTPAYASSSWDNSASTVELSDGTVVRGNATQYLSGGAKLNVSSGTLILSDGSVINTKTGLKLNYSV